MNYEKKYIKYKQKYIDLRNKHNLNIKRKGGITPAISKLLKINEELLINKNEELKNKYLESIKYKTDFNLFI